jgi:hypothetical protein
MQDYKYEIMMISESQAEKQFGQDLYALPPDLRDKLYAEASSEWIDRRIMAAELMEDR